MLPFQLVYRPEYCLPLPGHVFPGEKYALIRDRLLAMGVAGREDLVAAEAATDDDIRLVHTAEYVRKLTTGTLSRPEEMLLEIPFSEKVRRGFWWMTGGSIYAAQRALKDGVCFNLGGGFHHAFPDHGEGFCMVHDVAVAIRRAQRDGLARRAMVVDCDVHQGNGTAAIFAAAEHAAMNRLPSAPRHGSCGSEQQDVFTISLHQENNYPAVKPKSSIDVNLRDGVGDEEYLGWLEQALSSGLRGFRPDLICYIAGADPYREDQLGGLRMSIEGIKQRDRLLFRVAKAQGIPVMVTYAGGYARKVEDTVAIHANTVAAAAEVFADHGGTSC